VKIVLRFLLISSSKWIDLRQTKTEIISGPFYTHIVEYINQFCNYPVEPHVGAATWPSLVFDLCIRALFCRKVSVCLSVSILCRKGLITIVAILYRRTARSF